MYSADSRADFRSRVARIVGEANVLSPGGSTDFKSHYQVDGLAPALAVRPGAREEARDIVRLAREYNQSVIPIGAGTKLGIGMAPRSYDVALDITRLNRVLAYDPGDLTISVEAGCRLRDVQTLVAAQGQFLPFEPPHAADATIGGSLAANSWSLCAEGYGTPRDFVLGMEFVTGEGQLVHSGGRVVKNVTGYDLHKLMIGSLGTLGAMVSVNFRLYPLLQDQRLFAATFPSAESAFQMLHQVRASFLKPRTLVILDPGAAALMQRSGKVFGSHPNSWILSATVAGHSAAIERHERDLKVMAAQAGGREFIVVRDEKVDETAALLREFSVKLQQERPTNIGAQIGVLTTEVFGLLCELRANAEKENFACATLFQASGPAHLTVWDDAVSTQMLEDPNDDALTRLQRMAQRIFEITNAHQGHAVIQWCPIGLKSKASVWGESRSDFTLLQKVKTIFDPSGIFSPGRFVGGL